MSQNASARGFKPKYRKNSGFLPLPASFGRSENHRRQTIIYITLLLIITLFIFKPVDYIRSLRSYDVPRYIEQHPLTSPNIVETTSKYIFPPVEHASSLKHIGARGLVKESRVRDSNFPEIEKTFIQPLNVDDDPDPIKQKVKEEQENSISDVARAKNAFKKQDKVVYRPKSEKNYPHVVLVTAIDFDKYSQNGLVKIVQNRVDYGHEQNYGVYVRWYQEFLPKLHSFSYLTQKDKANWVRIYCLRAAMFSFPHAKWFWYLDEDALVMNKKVNLEQYLLSDEALEPIMKKGTPIIPPDGAIKTYKNMKANNVKLVITQSETMVDTTSFFVKNDAVSKGIIEFWGNELYLVYQNFQYGIDSALTHILQWHPFILSKTTVIPSRTMNSRFNDLNKGDDFVEPDKEKEDLKKEFNYHKGDLVVQWTDIEDSNSCEKVLDHYYDLSKSAKS